MTKFVDYYRTPCNAGGALFEDNRGLFAVELYCGCCECTEDCTEECVIDKVYVVEETTEEQMSVDLKKIINEAYVAGGMKPPYDIYTEWEQESPEMEITTYEDMLRYCEGQRSKETRFCNVSSACSGPCISNLGSDYPFPEGKEVYRGAGGYCRFVVNK